MRVFLYFELSILFLDFLSNLDNQPENDRAQPEWNGKHVRRRMSNKNSKNRNREKEREKMHAPT